MSELTLWLHIHQTGTFGQAKSLGLFSRKVDTPFAPPVGGEVEAWEDGLLMYVRRVYWKVDGSVHAELANLVVDPDDSERNWWAQKPNYGQPWWTQSEGPVEQLLDRVIASGWVRY